MIGVIANTAFRIKYTKLNRKEPILQVQSRLYRTKAFVNGCVTIALLSVVILPDSPVLYCQDFAGSFIVVRKRFLSRGNRRRRGR